MGGGTSLVAGAIVTPGENSLDWQNARLLLAKDTAGNYRVVGVDAQGRLLTDAQLNAGEIKLGAVEIEDNTSGLRADVAAAGGLDSLAVTSGILATEATLETRATQVTAAAILAALGPLATQATLATLGTEVTLATLLTQATGAFMLTALQIIDNIVVVSGATASTSGAQIMALAKDLIPDAVEEGEAVRILTDLFGQLYIKGYDRATGNLSVGVESTPRGPEPLIEDGWVALSAAGAETPQRDVRDFDNHTIGWVTSGIAAAESIGLIVWGMIGASWYPLYTRTISDADETLAVSFTGMQITYIKCELDVLTGAAAITFELTSK